jgi:hypothetical protein
MIGAIVNVKGRKARSKIVRVFERIEHWTRNDWAGWVEVDPPLSGYSRWPVEELEFVKDSRRPK